MKIALLLTAALVPALASADDPRAYVVHDGRGATAAPAPASPAAAPAFTGTTAQTSTFGSNAVHPNISMGDGSPAALAAAAAAATSAASGTKNFRSKRSSSKRGIGSVRKDAGNAPPPNYSKPGALIRTEGQLPTYTATNDAATHAVEGGTFVSQDPRHTVDSNRGPGVAWGAPDKAPTPNAGSGGGSGSGIVQNAAPGGNGGVTGSTQHADNGQGNNGQDNGQGNGKNASSTSGFDPAF
jgi:hypothetical protein